MKHIVVKLLALIALGCALATPARARSFAKRVDIGAGRTMYIECQGSGSPTVLLISGTDTASDLWHAADQKGPTVYNDIQKTTRVCAYDRPGAPRPNLQPQRPGAPADQSSKRGRRPRRPTEGGRRAGPLHPGRAFFQRHDRHGSSPASIPTKSRASCSLTSSRPSFAPR